MTDGLDPLVSQHMANTNASILRIESTLTRVGEAIYNLVRVEAEQRNQAANIERVEGLTTDHGKRLLDVEKEIPLLRQTHRWVVAGVLGIISMVGVQLYTLMTGKPVVLPAPIAITQPAHP